MGKRELTKLATKHTKHSFSLFFNVQKRANDCVYNKELHNIIMLTLTTAAV